MRSFRTSGFLLSIALAACGSVEDGGGLDGGGDGGLSEANAGVFSLYDPVAARAQIPFPNDALFNGFRDPTLNIPNGSENIPGSTAPPTPFVSAANLQDGFSTVGSLFTDFIGFVDIGSVLACPLTAQPNILIIDTSTGQGLVPCTDYTVQTSTAIDPSVGVPISAFRTRLLIEPLKPLKPSTRYIVALTTGVRSTDGVNATPSDLFRVVRSGTPVSQQNEPALVPLSSQQIATLEALRSQLVRPVVQILGAAPPAGAGIPEANVLMAWSFLTQSTTKTLAMMNANAAAATLGIRFTGLNASQLNPALGANANVYAGTITLPYFLAAATGVNDPTPTQLSWLADTSAGKRDAASRFFRNSPCGGFGEPACPAPTGNPAIDNNPALSGIPCAAFSAGATINGQTAMPSTSTSICYPQPLKRSDVTVPVLATVPNDRAMPADGWPVVIFQHGITRNRADMLAVGPTLARAGDGFVTIAIDLPLHGIVPTSPFAGLRISGVSERTFDLDLVGPPQANGCSGAPGPNGTTDGSGTHFVNLSNLAVSRDNLRQAVADLIVLTKSVPGTIFLDATGAPQAMNIDPARIFFVGHSLGGIAGTALLGVNTDIKAATLAMTGGGIARLLDGSKAFGPCISGGLQAATATAAPASRIIEGNDNYETFLRFAQTLTDSADAINFATAARANHPIHLMEVINDLVLPNATPRSDGSGATDRIPIAGLLSGTDPLIARMGLTTAATLTVGMSGIPAQTPVTGANLGVAVKFTQGNHGSILDPSGGGVNPAVTCEMQKQTATFLATGGTVLTLGGSCP